MHMLPPDIYVGALDLEAGLHACLEGPLLNESSQDPLPRFLFIAEFTVLVLASLTSSLLL